MLLKQVGIDNGDKNFQEDFPNLRCGEYKYYPQDNPNLKLTHEKHIKREAFITLPTRYFPQYTVSPLEMPCEYRIGSIGVIKEIDGDKIYNPIVINKGYICFVEATKEHHGTVYYIHNGVILAHEEKYKEISCN